MSDEKMKTLLYKHKLLISIAVVAVILRIAILLSLGELDSAGGDFYLYDRMARNLLAGGDFGGEPFKTLGSPNINPGFALWLTLLYGLFGFSALVPVVGQVVLGVLLVYGAYLLASLVFNKNAGLLAAFIVAIFPPLVILTIEPYNVLLYSALFLFSLFFLLKGLYTQRFYYGAISGVFLGAAALNESIAFYLPLVFGLWLIGLALYKIIDYKRAGLLFMIFILAFSLVLLPWAVRNMRVAKGDVRLVSKGELQLVTPGTVSDIFITLSKDGLAVSGLKKMFLLPYGIWRLDSGPISYGALPGKILKGEQVSASIWAVLAIKIFATIFYWSLFIAAMCAMFKFRILGTLLILVLLYTATAGVGYVAYQGGNFDTVSYLSLFIAPYFSWFAVLAGGLFTGEALRNIAPIKKFSQNKMKKIFYFANIRFPTEKAHGLAVMKMCEAFALEGLDVELLVPRRFNNIKQDPFDFYATKKNFKVKRLFCFDLTNHGKAGFLVQWLSFAGSALIYGFFHSADWYYGRDELSLWLISFFKKRVVWEAHTAKNNWLVRALVGRIRLIVTISRGLKNHFGQIAKIVPTILVAPSAVDLTPFDEIGDSKETLRKKLNLPPDQIIVAYVGKRQTMGQDKGVEKLEEASKIIKEKYGQTRLLVVSEAIPADVPLYMKAADILVMNYPNREHYAKFMSPLKLFEYMASGNPIVTSDLPSIREIVDESAVTFFEPDSSESLARAVSYVIDNPEESGRKVVKALLLVKEYTWVERVKKILEFIQNSS